MRYEDERYVRVYTRDTATWKLLPWQGKALIVLLFRKVDRAGIADLGESPTEGLAALVDLPLEVVEPGLRSILDRKIAIWVNTENTTLLLPNFLAAQEAHANDAQRKRDQRERSAAQRTLNDLGVPSIESRSVTDGHATGPSVTAGHAESQQVTPNLTVPSLKTLVPPSESRPRFDFGAIYARYPRRKNMAKGRTKLEAIVKTQAQYDAVVRGLDRFLAEERRKGTAADFYPHFATWVNQRRWEDEDDRPMDAAPPAREYQDLGDIMRQSTGGTP